MFRHLSSGVAFNDKSAIIFISVPLTPPPLVFHPLDSGLGAPLDACAPCDLTSLVHPESPHLSPPQGSRSSMETSTIIDHLPS